MSKFAKLLADLAAISSGANTICKDIVAVLEGLGFQIVDCGSAGHKIAKHPAIKIAEYPDFNCGHGDKAKVKPIYTKKLYKFVKQYEDPIKEYLK